MSKVTGNGAAYGCDTDTDSDSTVTRTTGTRDGAWGADGV